MKSISSMTIEDFYQFIIAKMSPQERLEFKASQATDDRIHKLLDKNNAGTITPTEFAELERAVQTEHFIGLLKAMARVTIKNQESDD